MRAGYAGEDMPKVILCRHYKHGRGINSIKYVSPWFIRCLMSEISNLNFSRSNEYFHTSKRVSMNYRLLEKME